MHVIAGKAVAMKEALTPEYIEYQKQTVRNAKVLAEELQKGGLDIVSGGTDNHMMLVDLRKKGITGKLLEEVLGKAHITVNKNGIPYDTESPMVTSGIRIGTPALTTRGMKEEEMREIAQYILEVVDNIDDMEIIEDIGESVRELAKKFPLYR